MEIELIVELQKFEDRNEQMVEKKTAKLLIYWQKCEGNLEKCWIQIFYELYDFFFNAVPWKGQSLRPG